MSRESDKTDGDKAGTVPPGRFGEQSQGSSGLRREVSTFCEGKPQKAKSPDMAAARNKAANFERAETVEELRKLANGIREQTTDSLFQGVTPGASSRDAVKG